MHVIDPDVSIREGLSALLGSLDIPVTSHANAQYFLDAETPCGWTDGCILVEAKLPGLSCLAFLKRLRSEANTLPVLVLTSTANRDIADQALLAGATDVLDKPLAGDLLVERLYQIFI